MLAPSDLLPARPLIASAMLICALTSGASRAASQQVNDSTFRPRIGGKGHDPRPHVVLIDAGHNNAFTVATDRLDPLKSLLSADGYPVRINAGRLTREDLRGVAAFVVATARGASPSPAAPAFSSEEIALLRDWVASGGGLLIAADHYPFDVAVVSLVASFGATMGIGYVRDSLNSYRADDVPPDVLPGWIVYGDSRTPVCAHSVCTGRDSTERVRRVVTFGGGSVSAPIGGATLLPLNASATNNPRDGVPPKQLATSQGVAFEFGRGRVVILADATMLTAQVVSSNGRVFRLGMARPDSDNVQFALNMMHWLTRADR